MLPLYRDPHFTFRVATDRLVPRFHLDCVDPGRRVAVDRVDPGTGERQELLATAVVRDDGWVDLPQPLVMRAGEGVRRRAGLPGHVSGTAVA
jgi:hypothetical protein